LNSETNYNKAKISFSISCEEPKKIDLLHFSKLIHCIAAKFENIIYANLKYVAYSWFHWRLKPCHHFSLLIDKKLCKISFDDTWCASILLQFHVFPKRMSWISVNVYFARNIECDLVLFNNMLYITLCFRPMAVELGARKSNDTKTLLGISFVQFS